MAPEQPARNTDNDYNNKSFHFYFTILGARIRTPTRLNQPN
jgi:hypothetical protein